MQTRVRAGFNLTEISWLVFDSSILPVIGCLAQPLLYHSSRTHTIPTLHLTLPIPMVLPRYYHIGGIFIGIGHVQLLHTAELGPWLGAPPSARVSYL